MTAISRRSLLRATSVAALAAGAAPLLAACGNGSNHSVSNEGKKLAPFPAYVPLDLVTPDLPGTAQGVQNAFLTYPQNLAQSVKDKPGHGETVTITVITYGTPPKAASSNKLWRAINDALGVDLKLNLVNAADQGTKYATLMAGNDLPDIIATIDSTVPNSYAFVQSKCQDLTEYISGDAIKDYPNLANMPTYAWAAVGRIGGKLYGVPVPRAKMGGGMFGNKEELAKSGITGLGITADQFTAGLAKLTDPKHWALGGSDFGGSIHLGAAGVSNNWSVKNSVFTSAFEDPRYAQVIDLMRSWRKKGYYYPDILTTQGTQAQTLFMNGTIKTFVTGFGAYPALISGVGKEWTVDVVRPYGDKPTPWLGSGIFANVGPVSFTALKKASPDRINLMLRVLNWLAAPFGSKEYELINYGVDGVHFKRDADGNPIPTDLATTGGENNVNFPIRYVAGGPWALYLPGAPDATRRMHQAQADLAPIGISDPSVGLTSDTSVAKGSELNKFMSDAINDIITGKRPVSSWNSIVSDWKSRGGSKIAAEFGREYASNH